MFRLLSCWGFVVTLLVLSGCGPSGKGLKVEYVEGVVTLDGEPVPKASITFIPVTDGPGVEAASGYTDDNGVYKLTSGNGDPQKGALMGDYKVIISKIESKSLTEGQPYGQPTGYAITYSQDQLLPKIYQNRTETPLAATVKKGRNTGMNFELTTTAP